jgi:hypothetical protein
MAAAFMLMAFDSTYRMWPINALVGWAGVTLLGALGVAVLLPALLRYPVLEATENHLLVRYLWMGGAIPWSNVHRVYAIAYGYAKYVGIDVVNPDSYISQQPVVFRGLLRAMQRRNLPICMALIDCGRSSERHLQAVAEIKAVQKRVRGGSFSGGFAV